MLSDFEEYEIKNFIRNGQSDLNKLNTLVIIDFSAVCEKNN